MKHIFDFKSVNYQLCDQFSLDHDEITRNTR